MMFGSRYRYTYTCEDILTYYKTCDNCGKRWEITAYEAEGFADSIEIYCPECEHLLGDFRVDISYIIREVKSNAKKEKK